MICFAIKMGMVLADNLCKKIKNSKIKLSSLPSKKRETLRRKSPMSNLTSHRYSEQGFTLIEIIVTLILLAVMAAISSPSLVGAWQQGKANQGLNELKSAIQEAQANANRMSKDCTITINGLADSTSTVTQGGKPYYEIASSINGCLGERKYIREDFLTIKSSRSNPGKGIVTFNFKGEPDGTSPQTFVIYRDNSTSTGKCLIVSSGIGMKRIGEYFGDASGTLDENNCKNIENLRYDN
jgi:prepilin-type N-terminal cleavage/methylation domain-containing protein